MVPMSERFFVLDGPNYMYRAYHALPLLTNSRGVPVHVTFGMSTMLWKILREEQPDYFVVAWDPPGPTFREQQFAAYKETRVAMPDDLRSQIAVVMRLFEALRLPVVQFPGFEADDVLATLVERTREQGIDMVLLTGDKDMLQLVDARVRVHSPGPRGGEPAIYDEAGVREKWGVEPQQIPDLLALMGDSIDNIPGVPGVGPKTAVKLISQFGSVDRLYENLPLVPGKLRETLAANRKQALLSRELATVSTRVPIEMDLEQYRRQEPDWTKLRALWTEIELPSLLRQLPAPDVVAVPAPDDPMLESVDDLARFLAAVPEGDGIAVDWVCDGGPPEPMVGWLGLSPPAAGGALTPIPSPLWGEGQGGGPKQLASRLLIGHDMKAAVAAGLARGVPLARLEDTAVAAYL